MVINYVGCLGLVNI